MTEFVIRVLETNPTVFWLVVILSVVSILVFAIAIVVQGRELKVGSFQMGPRVSSLPPSPEKQPTFTEEELEALSERLRDRANKIEEEVDHQSPRLTYNPPELSEKASWLFRAKIEIRNRLANIVLRDGDAWAGASLADWDIYVDYASIDETLKKDVQTYNSLVEPLLFDLNLQESDYVRDLEYLAVSIIGRLEMYENRKTFHSGLGY